jgi:hypothetical protein
MEMPLADIADRLSILFLKFAHGMDVKDEMIMYSNEYKIHDHSEDFYELLKVNSEIWNLEADIRKGKEGEFTLEEIGRRAIEIRNLNRVRVDIKNKIAKSVGQFEERKVNHASEN